MNDKELNETASTRELASSSPPQSLPDTRLEQSSSQMGQRSYFKSLGSFIVLLICVIAVSELGLSIGGVLNQEATGVFSVFANPPKTLDTSKCPNRVPPQQAFLFAQKRYYKFFKQSHAPHVNIVHNGRICRQGFQGNTTAYGLGVRLGHYMLWISTLTATHARLGVLSGLLHATLAYQLADIASLLVMTFRGHCTFSVELVIILALYQGSASLASCTPETAESGRTSKWTNWMHQSALFEATNSVAVVYQAWFWIWGFDGEFVEMPCGAYDFLGAPTSGVEFRMFRALMGFVFIYYAFEIMVSIFTSAFLFCKKINSALCTSNVYSRMFVTSHLAKGENQLASSPTDITGFQTNTTTALWSQYVQKSLDFVRRRLITSLVVHIPMINDGDETTANLRRIIHVVLAAVGAESLIWTNQISGVKSLDSTGQYFPFVIGICGLLACAYSFVKSLPKRLGRNSENMGLQVI